MDLISKGVDMLRLSRKEHDRSPPTSRSLSPTSSFTSDDGKKEKQAST